MFRKKCLGKINEIRDHSIISIGPETSKFKTVARLCLTGTTFFMFLFCISSGTVGIILNITGTFTPLVRIEETIVPD